MARILLCAVDAGAYNALEPVAKLLTLEDHQILWVTQAGKVASTKVTHLSQRCTQSIADEQSAIKDVLDSFKPHVVVAGVSGNGPDLALHLPQMALEAKIPVVKVLDFWGTGMPHEKGFAPTRVCALDEVSRHFEVKKRKMPFTHVIATGAPQFDALLWTEPLSQHRFIRGSIRPFLLLCGPSTEKRVREIFKILLSALESCAQPITIGTLWHPKSQKAEYESYVRRALADLSHVRHIDDAKLREIASNDVLLATADIVIGATSTELLKACYLRRPTLSIVPKGGCNHEVLTSRGIDMMPTSACGATAHAENAAEVCEFFKLFFPSPQNGMWSPQSEFMRKAQKRNYMLDGQNAQRVMKVVESLL